MRHVHHPSTLFAGIALLVLLAAFAGLGRGNAAPPAADVRTQAGEAQVWFAPFPKGIPAPAWQDGYGAADFLALFQGGDWEEAAGHTGVFKFYAQWILTASDADLQTAVSFLGRHNIAIAVETAGLNTGGCGTGVEGFLPGATELALRMARRVNYAGGRLAYITYDEPLTYAPGACGWTPTRIAQELAVFAKSVRREFPAVRFGDVEFERVPTYVLDEFLAAYRAQGEELDHLHWDVDWQRGDGWAQRALAAEAWARKHGVPFGMIYNGNADDASGAAWTANAADHMAMYEAYAGGAPDAAVFQSWHRFPQRVLPETDSSAFTWLINRYHDQRPALAGVKTLGTGGAKVVSGTLVQGPNGVGGQPVDVSVKPLDGPGGYALYTLTGTVPLGATTAAIAVRVNMECDCSGEADLTLYNVAFSEDGGPSRLPAEALANRAWWGAFGSRPGTFSGGAVTIQAHAGASSGLNSVPFQVTSGQPFTVTFAARVAPKSAGSGYFALMWNSSHEFMRSKLPLEPASQTVSAVTDPNGAFQVALGALPQGRYQAVATFPGNGALWPAFASVE